MLDNQENLNDLNNQENLTFEQALTRLETVVESMEHEDTTLEASITLYKEGAALSKCCNEILNRFETEVIMLRKDFDGSITEEPITDF
ncbi:MAG: exodeoxyribonuclease VII small subunit [Defluviitaleaceae bacterium]|nr:exodeoxyribonuclease VII small subunit [Defluviitaleaceae bacterium]